MAGKGILLDEHGELLISGRSMVIGETEMQETAIILQMNQGQLKSVPILGPDLVQLINTNAAKFDIEQRTRLHLAKDGKDYNNLKQKIQTTIR